MSTTTPPATGQPRTSGMAITSLVFGCASFMCYIFAGLPAILLGPWRCGRSIAAVVS